MSMLHKCQLYSTNIYLAFTFRFNFNNIDLVYVLNEIIT